MGCVSMIFYKTTALNDVKNAQKMTTKIWTKNE